MAHPNPWISKPLIVMDVNHSIKPLITNVNSPSDKTFNGSVSIIKIGRIMALIIPRNTDPTKAPHRVSSKPDRRTAVSIIASMFNNHLNTHPCM
jgi:hypothetical protein